MSLTKCEECGSYISSEVKNCHCGADRIAIKNKKRRKKQIEQNLLGCLGYFVILIIFAFIGVTFVYYFFVD